MEGKKCRYNAPIITIAIGTPKSPKAFLGVLPRKWLPFTARRKYATKNVPNIKSVDNKAVFGSLLTASVMSSSAKSV